jgi:hypothetical protein
VTGLSSERAPHPFRLFGSPDMWKWPRWPLLSTRDRDPLLGESLSHPPYLNFKSLFSSVIVSGLYS